jgi:hypothetical protein
LIASELLHGNEQIFKHRKEEVQSVVHVHAQRVIYFFAGAAAAAEAGAGAAAVA